MSNYTQHLDQISSYRHDPAPQIGQDPEFETAHAPATTRSPSRLRTFFHQVRDHEKHLSSNSAEAAKVGTSEKNLRRAKANEARQERRQAAREQSTQYREVQKLRRADEKARKVWLGGAAWGFDPTAGTQASSDNNEADGGCYVSAGRSLQGLEGVDEIDDLGRRTGRRSVSHNLWGVERGGPGKEGKYGHGSLRTTEKEAAASPARRTRNQSPWRSEGGY
jgi:hypothetical protein